MKKATKLKSVPTLADLSLQWVRAKADEKEANERRVAIEEMIAAELPAASSEDTRHAEVDGRKVTVKYGLSRKVDTTKLQPAWDKLTENQQSAFRWKADVTLPKLRALQELLPEQYAAICAYIETKPSKPSVSVEIDPEVPA